VSRATSECNAGRHAACPGYYLTAHPCGCPCHRPPPVQDRRCLRPTKTGGSCGRGLAWYETACTSHATPVELDRAYGLLKAQQEGAVQQEGAKSSGTLCPFTPMPSILRSQSPGVTDRGA
jgi:hypothetical protein